MLKRYGAVATIEWQPSDSFHSTFDALYSHFEEAQHLRGIEFPLGFSDPTKSNIVVDNGFATATTFDRSEEHTSELQSLMRISYAVFCLKKKKPKNHSKKRARRDKKL